MNIFYYTSYLFLISLILYSLFTSPFSPSVLPPATFDLIRPHFVSVFPPVPFRTIQSSILHVLNLLCVDVRKLLSHPFPLTHFPPFSSSSCSSITIPSFSPISSFSHLYPYNFSYLLRHPVCPICPLCYPVAHPCLHGSEAEWKLNAQSAVTPIDLYSPIYRLYEEVC